MKKKLASLILSLAMVLTMLPVQVFAESPAQTIDVIFSADHAEVFPGESVNMHVTLGAVPKLDSITMALIVPEGMSLVSGELTAQATAKFNNGPKEFDLENKLITMANFGGDYTLSEPLPLADFVLSTGSAKGGNYTMTCRKEKEDFTYDGGSIDVPANITPVKFHIHDLKTVPAVAATCSKEGNIEYEKCTLCGKMYNAEHKELSASDIVVPKTAHIFNQKVEAPQYKVPGKDATCQHGTQYYVSCVCGEMDKSQTFEANDKIPHQADTQWHHGEEDPANHWHLCTMCGEKMDVTAHTFGKWTIVKDSTETEEGLKERTCTACGHKETATIPTKEHEHHFGAEWKYDETNHWHECTCGEKANTAAHTYTSKVTKAPTCTEKGEKTYTCSVCGQSYTEDIPAAGHKFDTEWHNDAENHWHECTICHEKVDTAAHTYKSAVTKQPTCTEKGEKTYTCSVCGRSYTEDIPATGHKFDTAWHNDAVNHWHECTICGEKVDTAAHTYKSAVTKQPTCTEKGEKTYTCSVCGRSYTEDIPATGHHFGEEWKHDKLNHWHECACGEKADVAAHTYESEVTKQPTCTEAGVRTYTCSVCGHSYTEKIPATGHKAGTEWSFDQNNHWHICSICNEKVDTAAHTYGEWTVIKAPTCTEKGSQERTCTVCGHKEIQEIPMIPHTFEEAWQKDANGHWHVCSVCGTKSETELHTFGDWTIIKNATETEEGLKEHTCTICGHKEKVIIPTKEHEHQFGEEWKYDKDNHWHECRCGEKADIAAHTYESKVTKAATCTEAGVKTYTCSVCGHSYDEVIPATGHKFDTAWHNDADNHWHECTICGEKVDTAAHTYTSAVTKAPTCTEAGVKTYTCSVCGHSYTEEIPATGHKFDTTWHDDETGHWHECTICGEKADEADHTYGEWTVTKAATCTEKGSQERACTVCGHKDIQEIPMIPHTFDEQWHSDAAGHWHECTVCGTKSDIMPHAYGDWKVIDKATETEKGLKERVCACGHKETATIPCIKVLSDDEFTWKTGSSKNIVIKTSGNADAFFGVEADGKMLGEKDYTVTGSTVITLKPEYLSTLALGEHRVVIIFNEGECDVTLNVVEKNKPVNPDKPEKPDHHRPDKDDHVNEDIYYPIRAKATEGGSISPEGSVSVKEGNSKTFTFKPEKGFIVSKVLIDGESIEYDGSGEYTFSNVKDMHTIEVRFAEATKVNPSTGAVDFTAAAAALAFVTVLGGMAVISKRK